MKFTRALQFTLALVIAVSAGLGVVTTRGQDDVSPDTLILPPAPDNPGSGGGPRPGARSDDLAPRELAPGENYQDGALFQYGTIVGIQPLADDLAGLLQQFQAAEADEQRSALKTKLTDTLGRQFDARQKRHEQQIAELEAQVKKLRDLVRKRQTNREEIISLRLEQMLRETQGLGW